MFVAGPGVEAAPGELIRQGDDEGLIVRGPATQTKAVDLLAIGVDFTAGQAVGPERIQREAMAQELHGAGLIRAAKIDDSTARWKLQVERPRRRKGGAVRVVFGIEQTVQPLESQFPVAGQRRA